MTKDRQQSVRAGPDSAAERFRMHLRQRLAEMRENAHRIGASSAYIESLDRSASVVLSVVGMATPKKVQETEVGPAEPIAVQAVETSRT
jgi:hypothetical protein